MTGECYVGIEANVVEFLLHVENKQEIMPNEWKWASSHTPRSNTPWLCYTKWMALPCINEEGIGQKIAIIYQLYSDTNNRLIFVTFV